MTAIAHRCSWSSAPVQMAHVLLPRAEAYSADALFGLLLPAMAAWSIERVRDYSRFLIAKRTHRPAVFWIVAAIAQWSVTARCS